MKHNKSVLLDTFAQISIQHNISNNYDNIINVIYYNIIIIIINNIIIIYRIIMGCKFFPNAIVR